MRLSSLALVRRVLLVATLCAALPVVGVPRLAVAAPPAGASRFVALAAPVRLADTRPSQGSFGYTSPAANTLRIPITGRADVDDDATAAVVSVSIVGSTGPGYLTVFPAGDAAPVAASVNSDAAGRTISNLAHVKVGAGGSIDLYRGVASDVAVDLVGFYVPVTDDVSAGRLVTLGEGSRRALDTRIGGSPLAATGRRDVDLAVAGVPPTASAAVVTLTAVGAPIGGWTVSPMGAAAPAVNSLVLDRAGQTRAAQAIVPLVGGDPTVSVRSSAGGNFVVDVVGWYTGDSDAAASNGLFIASAPKRRLDTRNSTYLAPWGGSTFEFTVASPLPDVQAVTMNLAVTRPWDNGYFTAYPAGLARPTSSGLNTSAWPQTIAGHVVARVSDRGLAIYTSAGAHIIADVTGYFTGTPSTATYSTPSNPNYQPNVTKAVSVPRLGIIMPVAASTSASNLTSLATRGYAAAWSTNLKVATVGNVMLFGHRTTSGGPFRYINGLKPGDVFSLVGNDLHAYNYRVMYVAVTVPTYAAVNSLSAMYGPITAQLVACSKADGSPTSLKYRITVTARLVSVT
ncbi:MAG: hypothetical protein RLZ14_1622 [Actinomycetota bacterium]